jgi:hypothetical protein
VSFRALNIPFPREARPADADRPGDAHFAPRLVAGVAPKPPAGLFEKWTGPDGDVESCCIVTTAPSELVQSNHNRMPVILDPAHLD